MTVKNAMQFVELCERRLGYVLDPSLPMYKARMLQAGRLKKYLAKHSDPAWTWDNLELAVEFLVRKREPIQSPVYVTHFVRDALKEARQDEVRPLGDQVRLAIQFEYALNDEQSEQWAGQLARAVGKYRQDALDEWREARAHLLHSEVAA